MEWDIKTKKSVKEKIETHMREAISNIFSTREKEIIQLIQKGKRSKEIAALLFISKNTVDTHRRNMLRKSNSFNASELIKFAQDNGII